MSENVREVLELAFFDIFGREPDKVHIPEWNQWRDREIRFKRFLDTGAYVNAALMLVPEGWQCSIVIFSDGSSEAVLTDDRVNPVRLNDIERMGDSPALAIAQAALAAKGAGGE